MSKTERIALWSLIITSLLVSFLALGITLWMQETPLTTTNEEAGMDEEIQEESTTSDSEDLATYTNEEMRLSFDYPTDWTITYDNRYIRANKIAFMSLVSHPYLGPDRGAGWPDLAYAIDGQLAINDFCTNPIALTDEPIEDDYVDCEIITNDQGVTYAKSYQIIRSEGGENGPYNLYYFYNPYSIDYASIVMLATPEVGETDVFEQLAASMRWDSQSPQTTKTYEGESFMFEYGPELYLAENNLWTEEGLIAYRYPPEGCEVCAVPYLQIRTDALESTFENHISNDQGFGGKTFDEITEEYGIETKTHTLGNKTFISITTLGKFPGITYYTEHEDTVYAFTVYELRWDLDNLNDLEEMLTTLSFK